MDDKTKLTAGSANRSWLTKLFGFDPSSMKVSTEILAGITTFLAMSYILAVNPSILADCGMDKNALFTTTAVASIFATLVMAIYGKLPFALAPGMGLNAFFCYTVCLGMGYSWQFALTAVLIEGLIFIVLTLTNVREAIVNALPLSLRKAIGAGIGLFIALIGLKGGGIVIDNPATLVDLGDVTSGAGLLSVIGLVITGILVILNVPGALLIGIIATTIIGIPLGVTQFAGVLSTPPSMKPILGQIMTDPSQIFSLDMLVVVFTFLFVDMFDTIGTLVGVTTKANMVDEKGNPKRLNQAFMADAVGTVAGALLGTSTVTTYVESASGVAQGGRSGLTAFSVAVCFALAMFFAPLFTAIPGSAVCPALVIVGLFMLSPIKDIPLDDMSEAIPAYLTMILMPVTYSISNGILLGLISYVVLNICSGKAKKVSWFMAVLALLFVLKFIFL
ncbi:MAG: NCS2 family permease [Bacteroidales bacterium]|uniref:NCS2 family permease n=1 Tax=Candidatus Cryptobacteroides sp. TaxID=2952915 RepID=UPI002A757C59|nr:NCS2 family permease [Candidatus Cryptobacteroides sp.]MBS7277080.1 NCS2 family permease [Bacteroidales bacterium]MDD7235102.1 NCS2 family permease [Bacteroidales bacterium]MDY2701170.1 NCS2 family permease [Candidatus Cryptobacteroides sp.]